DYDDLSTAASLKACFGNAMAAIGAEYPDVVFVRNHHMAAKAQEHAQATGARIMIQQCGDAHVAWHKGWNYRAQDSLSAVFRARNIPFQAMPVLCAKFRVVDIPADHGLTGEETLFVSGLPETEARYDEFDRPVWNRSAGLQCRADEAACLNALLAHLDRKTDCLSVGGYLAQKEESNSYMKKLFQEQCLN
ncbi:MAG: hypothetical protein ACREIW_09360, partial [Chthoniobacterales bacterium]